MAHNFIKRWKKENLDILSSMYPEVNEKDIIKFLNKQIKENLINRECKIHNNYIHKSMDRLD